MGEREREISGEKRGKGSEGERASEQREREREGERGWRRMREGVGERG